MANRRSGRRAGATVLVIAVVVATFAVAWVAFGDRMPWPGAGSPPAVSAVADPGIPPRPADAFAMTVASVWDGDTLRATVVEPNDVIGTTDEVRIRVIGVDAPERSPDECGALAARDALLELLPPGSTVWAQPGADPLDRYERRLLYLWTDDGRFVNLELVARGAAETMSIEPNVEHAELLAAAQAEAEASRAGLWGSCR